MHKRIAAIIVFPAALSAQTITWTKQTGVTNPPYGAQWIQMVPNPVSHNTLMFGDDNGQGADIFMNSLYGMTITNPISPTGLVLQKLGTSGTHTNGCPFARPDWPGDNQFNKGVWWDYNRNKAVLAFGVCTLGHPDASDRFPAMWQYVPSSIASPTTRGEKWARLNPTVSFTAFQPWLSVIHDPVDDLYFAYGFETSAAPPKLFCPTDRNPTPGTLTSAQTTAGCTVADGWTEPASSTYLCKATPGSTAVACSNATIPPINALPYLAWDTATSKIVMFGEGSAIANLGTAQTWIYDPPTKTFTNVSSLSTPPPVWLTNGDQIAPMAFNPNDGLYYFHQKAGYTISIATAGSGYTPGTYSVLWTGSCTNKTSATYTVDSTNTVVSVSPTWTSMSSADCVGIQAPSATQSNGGGIGATFNFTWNAQRDWTLTSGTWVWTNLGAFTGPATAQSMEIDPAWNTIIVWAYTSAGASEMWLGQISGTYSPTITTVGLPGGTNGVAYAQQLSAGTTSGAVTWTASGLPMWASLSSGGLLTGTPNAVGTTTFSATATNSSGATNKSLSITVAPATLSVPITVEEALYPGGTTGVARSNEPFCLGVPIPDAAQIDAGKWNTLGLSGADAGLTTLGLTGATAGQFRVLAVWPDGYAKWVEACGILASLNAGGTATVTLTNSGTGNFGGANLASTSDPSNTIVVNTGTGTCGTYSAKCFTLKKLNHNGLDQVQIGTTTVLNTGSGQLGYTVNGPDYTATYPNNVTCVSGTSCLGGDLYNTAADAFSYCKIEKNGPVQTVIYCSTTHAIVPSTPRPYMRTIVRYYFTQGSTAVKATVTLANEDTVQTGGSDVATYGASLSGTFASAWKNFESYELRQKLNISGTLTFQIGTNAGDSCSGLCTGTLNQSGGTDFAYIYQGRSTSMQSAGGPAACGSGCVQPTTDTGYSVVNDTTTLVSPTASTVYPQGWADIANSSGVGVEIGIYQLAANYPASLEFQAGGNDVRIGLFSSYNSQTYYMPWPNQVTRDIWMEFHTSTPSSPGNEFLKFQHPLVGRADYTWYNSTGVFPYQLVSSATEDAYYNSTQSASLTPAPSGTTTISSVTTTNPVQITIASSTFASGLSRFQELLISGASGCSALNGIVNIWAGAGTTTLTIQNNQTQISTSGCGSYVANSATISAITPIGSSAACCISDLGTANTATWPILLYHSWAWGSTGGANQDEFRFSNLMAFITRGMTGRYLDAWHWYRYIGDLAWPRSLGFDWRGTPATSTYLDGYGFPSRYTQTNTGTATQIWINSDSGEHSHWYGMPYGYLMTGDETLKEAMLDGTKDYFLLTTGLTWSPSGTYQTGSSGGNGLYNARAVGANLNGAAEFSTFLASINDPDSTGVINLGIADYSAQVKPALCASGYPTGCSLTIDEYPTAPSSASWSTTGVNPARGVFDTKNQSTASNTWCGVNHTVRGNETFMSAILVKGMLRLRASAGSGWTDYWNSLDLADGIARQNTSEMYYDDGSGRWDVTGFRYMQATDWANNCTGTSEYPRPEFAPQNINAAAPLFLARYLTEGGTTWKFQFNNYLQRNMAADGFNNSSPAADLETILPESVIAVVGGSIQTLQTLTCSFTDNGGGAYTLSSCPGVVNASYYRVKFSTANPITDWIGYDAGTASFIGSPSATTAWFAATNASSANSTGIPAPSASAWSITINTGQTGLTASNFRINAMAPNGSGGTLATPTFSPIAGTYVGTQSIIISGPSGATICYNTTGSLTATVAGTCDAGSTTYSGAVPAAASKTLYAIATEATFANSSVASAGYNIGLATGGSFFSGTLGGNSVIH